MLLLCRLSVRVSDKHTSGHDIPTGLNQPGEQMCYTTGTSQTLIIPSLVIQETVANGCRSEFCKSEASHSGFVITDQRLTRQGDIVLICINHQKKKLSPSVLTYFNRQMHRPNRERLRVRSPVADPFSVM